MAQFDADIKLKVAVENLEQSVRKVENAFKKIQDYRVKVKVDGQTELNKLGNSFKRLGTLLKGSGVVTAVAAISGSLASLNNLPIIGGGLNTSGIGRLVDQLGGLSNAAVDAAAAQPGLAAGILATSAAAIAFAPQIARAAKDTLRLGRVAAEAAVPIKALGQYLGSQSAQGILGIFGDLPNAERLVKAYRDRLFELNETVSELSRRQGALKSALDGFNSGSVTAEKIASKLVDVNQRLNDELREQADLLRRVRGVNVTELEATKGRKSIETKARARDFRARQRQEELQVQQALSKLEERGVSALQQVLGINQNVLNIDRQRTQELQKQQKIQKSGRGRAALENALIGGAFPLLFGQGAGASLGGALGGAAGGLGGGQLGFGLSLIGTALGTAADEFVKKLSDVAAALKSPKATLEALEDAGNKVDFAIKKQVESLLELGQVYEAQQVALKAVRDALGPDAVEQLAQYEKESRAIQSAYQDIINDLQKELLPVLVTVTTALAEFIGVLKRIKEFQDNKNPVFKGIDTGAQVGRAVAGDPISQIGLLFKGLQEAGKKISKGAVPGLDPEAQAEAAKIIAKQTEEKDKLLVTENRINNVLTAQLEQATLNKDITTEAGYEAAKKVIYKESDARIQDIINSKVSDEVKNQRKVNEELRLKLQLKQLENKRNAALARAAESAPKSKELSLRQNIIKEDLKQLDIALQYKKLKEGEEAFLRAQNDLLLGRQNRELEIIELQRQQALENNKVAADVPLINELYNKRAETLRQSLGLLQEQNKERLKAIQLERELAELEGTQKLENLRTGLNRQIEDAQRGLASPFGGDEAAQRDLATQQARRLQDEITSRDQEIARLQKKIDAGQDKGGAAAARITRLQKEKDLFRELLPELDAYEQKLLKQQQIIQKYGFIADEFSRALSDSITGLIDGTTTVEEAFSRMFANIGKAFIDMATQILAQKAFLAVLEGLTGGSGPKNIPIPGNYSGGPLASGSPSIVGERGPELFVPNVSGRVVNNEQYSAARQAMSAGASRQSTAEARQEEAQLFEATVNNMDPIDIRYDSTQINSVSYVTEEQMLRSNKMAVKEAQAKVFSAMRNKPGTRAQIGVG